MSNLKLSYFNFPVRGEFIRLAFAIGGVKFENEQFPYSEWSNYKSSFKYQQVPVLTIDGQQYGQSLAILKYAAAKSGLLPQNPLDFLKTDQLAENANELINLYVKTLSFQGEDLKKAREKMVQEDFTKILGFIEKDLQDNGSNGYIVGNKLTYGDVILFTHFKFLTSGKDYIPTNLLEKYPSIAKVLITVGSNKKVQEWYAKNQ